MLRRAPAAVLLLALLLRGAASLHACEAARAEATPSAGAAVHAPHDAYAGHDGHARTCDRTHAGRCPHAGGAAFHRCQTDPAAGLAAAAEAALPAAGAAALAPPPAGEPRPSAAETAPGLAPLPEAPPPRSLA